MPRPLSEARPGGAPAQLQAILDRTLAKDPRQRYQKVGELRDDLRAVLRDVEMAGTQTFNEPITPIAPRHLSGTGRFGRAMRWLRSKTGERTSQPREISFERSAS